RSRWSPQWQSDLAHAAETAQKAVQSVAAAVENVLQALSLPACGRDRRAITALADLVEVLARARERSYAFALTEEGPEVISALREAAALLEERRAAVAGLSCRYSQR